MAERPPNATTRPRPGPRPNPSAHGKNRRRVGERTKAPAQRSAQPSKRKAPSKPRTSKATIRVSDHAKAKRTAHQKAESRSAKHARRPRSLRWWLLIALTAACSIFIGLFEAPFFEVNDVEISGASRTSEGAILEALAVSDDQALLTYDTAEGRDELGALAWVQSVDVTRQWPSSLRVVIRERAVVAAIGRPDGTEWIVVSNDGLAVESRMSPPSGVPLIVATQGIVDASSIGAPVLGVERVLEIARGLPLQLAPWITTWSIDSDGVVVAELVGSARADFGALDDHRTQYVSLASILNGGADLVCIDTIDLRIADTPVLHRDASCLLASQELD